MVRTVGHAKDQTSRRGVTPDTGSLVAEAGLLTRKGRQLSAVSWKGVMLMGAPGVCYEPFAVIGPERHEAPCRQSPIVGRKTVS